MRKDRHAPGRAGAEHSAGEKHSACFEASASTLGEIGIESHENSVALEWNDCRCDLRCATQIIAATSDIESPLNHSDQSCARLPCYAIGKPPLDLQRFVALHPCVEGHQNFGRRPAYRSRCCSACGSRDAGEETLIFWNGHTLSFFR